MLAEKGWRFLDGTLPSNQPVPLRMQMFTLVQTTATGPVTSTVAADANGEFMFVPAANATSAEVTDTFGNRAGFAVPM